MRTVLLVAAAWTAVSLVTGLVFAIGSSIGFRRGYEEGFEAGQASADYTRADGRRDTGELG